MRTLPPLPGRAVIAALERAGFEVPPSLTIPRSRGREGWGNRIISCGTATTPADKPSCRYIEKIYPPEHFARYCGKRASAGPSSLTCSERMASR
jgi:hypothetical protein